MASWWQRFWPRFSAYVLAVVVTAGGASAANCLLLVGTPYLPITAPGPLLLAMGQVFVAPLPLLLLLVAGVLLVLILLAGWLKPAVRPLAPFAYPLAGWAALALALWWLHAHPDHAALAAASHPLGFLIISFAGIVGGMVFALLRKRRLG